MSMYGYDSGLSQGTTFNAKERNFNDRIRAQNNINTVNYNSAVKDQKKNVSGDKTLSREHEAFYGAEDGKGALATGVGLFDTGKSLGKLGAKGFAKGAISDRLGSVTNTMVNLRKGGSAAEPAVLDMSSDDTAIAARATPAARRAAAAVDTSAGAVADTSGAVESGFKETESSGLGTTIIKATLEKVGVGKAFGKAGSAAADAGLSATSEIAGKAAGEVGGFIDIGEGIDNLGHNKNFFSGQSTGDVFQEAGAVTDLVGTVFPPLELVGGALSLIGGIMDASDDLSALSKKKKEDAAKIAPPTKTSTSISPVFSSLGLIASKSLSAKQSIQGTRSF